MPLQRDWRDAPEERQKGPIPTPPEDSVATAAGLIHVSASPAKTLAEDGIDTNLLVRQAAERGYGGICYRSSKH